MQNDLHFAQQEINYDTRGEVAIKMLLLLLVWWEQHGDGLLNCCMWGSRVLAKHVSSEIRRQSPLVCQVLVFIYFYVSHNIPIINTYKTKHVG